MALAFSLTTALLATLVQQWVRDYMHVFDRYSNPQKSARMRQYLYEGSERWHMHIAAEAVPGLLHISLFLFFAGLADSTLNINTTIGICTAVPIGICGLLYLLITLAPVIYPQSPYQTSYSGVFWYAIQKLFGRRYKDRDGKSKSVNTNMAQGQMQLSTEGTIDREGRDKRAILWLMDNLTEDAEIESFVTSMPGSLEEWAELSKKDVQVKPPVFEYPLLSRTIRSILSWVTRQFRVICKVVRDIPTIFCATLWSILCAPCLITVTLGATIFFICGRCFLNIRQGIRSFIHRQFTASSSSTIAIALRRPFIATSDQERNTIREFCWRVGHFFNTSKNGSKDEQRQKRAIASVEVMASLVSYADVELGSFGDTLQTLGDNGNFEGMHNLLPLLDGRDETFVMRRTCLSIMAIRSSQNWWRGITEDIPGIIGFEQIEQDLEHQWVQGTEHESGLSSKISFAADITQTLDGIDFNVAEKIEQISQGTTRRLPGVDLDFPDSEPFPLELFRDPAKLRFICCRQPLSKFFDYLKRLDGYPDNSPKTEDMLKQAIDNVFWPKHLLQRMSWSRDDLKSGGLGFVVELFLLFLKQILSTSKSTSSSQESYSAIHRHTSGLYI